MTRPTFPKSQAMLGSASNAIRTQRPYTFLSACARGDQTAGPRLRLSSLNWMPVASIARPINPPSASISRTRCPFAVPPTAGLQGMCATVSFESVGRPTLHPSRAAAYAASTPACPAPMTMTSNRILLAYAEPLEDMAQYIFARATADDLVQARARSLQIRQQKFLWNVRRCCRITRRDERNAALLEQRDVTRIRDRCGVPQPLFSNKSISDCVTQFVEAVSGARTHRNAWCENLGGSLRDRSMASQVCLVRYNDPIDCGGVSKQLFVCVGERFTTVEHEQHEIGDATRPTASRDALGLDDVERFAPASGVDERNFDAADVHVLGYKIARRAWNRSHNRAWCSC